MIDLSDDEWKRRLTPKQYATLRQKATEAPGTGELLYNTKTGDYTCAGCSNVVFQSDTKFDSPCGWPSFYDVADTDAVRLVQDNSLSEPRIEVLCANCGGHLGHVFHDAPDQPTGLRFCINSAALTFKGKV